MKVLYRPSFVRAFKKLSATEQKNMRLRAAELAEVFGRPHLHAGLGIRRLGNFFEFRSGLKIRVLFVLDGGDAVLITAGNHDDIARWIKDNA